MGKLEKDIWLGEFEVGDYYESVDTYEVTKEEMIHFAKRYDPQYFHTDPKKARNSFFGELVSSGWLTVGMTMNLQVKSHPFGFDLIGIDTTLEWPSPTIAGDNLKFRAEIIEIKMSHSKPDRGVITLETVVTNQKNETRMIMQNKILGFKRSTD